MPAELPRALIGLFAFIFGASIGSFVNVLAYRIPREISILRPGSFCPQCRAAIPFWANVPLIAWIALRARCVKCHAPIPFRYFLTELIIALEGLYLFLSYAPADAFARLILCAALFAVALIDYDWRVIPSAITLGGIPIGFIAAAFMITEAGWLSSLIGIAAGAGFLFITGELYLRLRHQEGVGLGDVFLMGMIGAFLGWQGVLFTLFIGSMIGAIGGITFALIGGTYSPPDEIIPEAISEVTSERRGDRPPPVPGESILRTEVPFGPYLAAAATIFALFQPLLLRWYLPS